MSTVLCKMYLLINVMNIKKKMKELMKLNKQGLKKKSF